MTCSEASLNQANPTAPAIVRDGDGSWLFGVRYCGEAALPLPSTAPLTKGNFPRRKSLC